MLLFDVEKLQGSPGSAWAVDCRLGEQTYRTVRNACRPTTPRSHSTTSKPVHVCRITTNRPLRPPRTGLTLAYRLGSETDDHPREVPHARSLPKLTEAAGRHQKVTEEAEARHLTPTRAPTLLAIKGVPVIPVCRPSAPVVCHIIWLALRPTCQHRTATAAAYVAAAAVYRN